MSEQETAATGVYAECATIENAARDRFEASLDSRDLLAGGKTYFSEYDQSARVAYLEDRDGNQFLYQIDVTVWPAPKPIRPVVGGV